ncbi:hypothetical protein PLESTB_001625100 [Pleodorina starrii]|uniref:Uncharacterized protein n=1 Tax=Pleodorina starrii TaxID=330485 RepID=A0A9W6BYP2_9CHLO|nr:hypothetical protein PLESTB_001625100 [Pleodorina starrii]
MADRLQGSSSQRRPGAAPLGLNPDVSGRGPTYERVQRLLEERRARAQAQLSARGQREDNEAAPGPLRQVRGNHPFSSPDSDGSFAFDRPPYTSDGGDLDAPEEHASAMHPQQHRSEVSSVYAQGTWQQQQSLFEVPSGHSDEDEGDGMYGAGASQSPDPRARFHASQNYSREYSVDDQDDYSEEDEGSARFNPHDQARQQGAGSRPDDVSSDGQTLAELEQMMNRTIQQFNIEAMRVPTSKDMAFGMAHGDGPFDISDIWAVDSQPSGSQRSASQRQGPSEGGASRDDGHEVNSYSGTDPRSSVTGTNPRSSVSQDSSYAGGHAPLQRARLSARDLQLDARPGSAQPGMLATLQQRESQPQQQQAQQQQQQAQQQHKPQLGLGARISARVQSAGGAPELPRRPQQQQEQSLLAQHGVQRPRTHTGPQAQGKGAGGDAAILRRPSTPTGRSVMQQPKAVQPSSSPRYARPIRSGVSPGRDGEPAEGCTFQPQINPRSREIAQRLLPVDRERRLELLCRHRNDRVEQRCQQLRQEKEAEELRDCTFQPQTGRHPSIQRLRGGQPVHDRLYHGKPAWQLRREDILREREQAALASCTFQPQCGSRSASAARRRPASATTAGDGGRSTPYVPIHQRVADLLRSRNEKLAKAQVQMELGGGSVTFQPEINRRSVALAAERQRQQPAEVAMLPASERLYRLAQEQGLRRRGAGDEPGSAMRDISTSRDQRASFQSQQQQQPWGVPAINPRSRALAESSDLPQDFLARQAYLAALGHEKRALYRSLLEESTCTFQPRLLSRAGSLNSSCGFGNTPRGGGGGGGGSLSRWSGSDGDGDRVSKLAYEDVQKSAALRDALAQHHYGQFTFTPAINERSRRIGRRHSLTDLYRADERQAKLERLAAEAEAQRAAECTFRPAINPRSASMGRLRRGSLVLASTEVHEQANKLRSSILTEARALREYEELKECTFTPAINRTVPKPAGPIAVPGLGRYMELKELARKKREAEEARKEEVWHARPKSPGPPAGITVPRPFSFDARVLPWQAPRAQDQEHQQRKALTVLKQQRLQQRRDAEERRSAHLHKIMQEAQAAHHQHHNHNHGRTAAGPGAGAAPARALMAAPPAVSDAANGGGGGGRRRSVTFQSPSTGQVRGRGSPHGVAEMPADADDLQNEYEPSTRHMSYDGSDVPGSRDGFELPSDFVEEELSMRF